MKKGKILTSILTVFGILLIFASAFLMFFSHLKLQEYTTESRKTAEKILQMMPKKTEEFLQDENKKTMPVFEIDDVDYIGVIDIPVNGGELPVAAYWDANSVKKYPCRYTGSINDNSLIVGGYDSNGQFAMIKTLAIGQKIELIDVSGRVFSYVVEVVEVNQQATSENLQSKNSDLTLFVKNSQTNNYVIVRCKLK